VIKASFKYEQKKNGFSSHSFLYKIKIGLPYAFDKFLEDLRIFNRHLAHHFPINGNFFGSQQADKLAVFESQLPAGDIEPGYPERPESSFFGSSVAKSILAGLNHCLLGGSVV